MNHHQRNDTFTKFETNENKKIIQLGYKFIYQCKDIFSRKWEGLVLANLTCASRHWYEKGYVLQKVQTMVQGLAFHCFFFFSWKLLRNFSMLMRWQANGDSSPRGFVLKCQCKMIVVLLRRCLFTLSRGHVVGLDKVAKVLLTNFNKSLVTNVA